MTYNYDIWLWYMAMTYTYVEIPDYYIPITI